jgi:RNA-directed DNA polymerase
VLQGKVVRPRFRANTQEQQTLMAAWQGIPWKQVQRQVFRLQKRMYHATQRGDVRTVHKRHNLLTKSW